MSDSAAPTPASSSGGVASAPSSPSPAAPSSPSPQAPATSSAPQSSQAEAPRAGETHAEAVARKMKLKVNGVEREFDEATVIRKAQLAESAEQKFQEAAKLRKQTEAFIEALRSDPMSVLTNPQLGLNFRELAEQYLAKEIGREMLTPEQREIEELRQFKAERERQEEEARQAEMTTKQQAEFKAQQVKYAQAYDREITDALTGSGLPRTPQTLKRVAELMHNALSKGYELDAVTAADMVRESYQSDISQLYGQLDGEKLLAVLGEDLAKKIRMYDLQRLKAKQAPPPVQEPAAPAAPVSRREPKPAGGMKTNEWMEAIRKKAGIE